MAIIDEIIGSVPQLSSWAFITLCQVSLFTSLISAAFGLKSDIDSAAFTVYSEVLANETFTQTF